MDEQRQQAYYQLIENLLRCPDGEESEILVANTDLLDAGFWQTLEAVAEDFAQQGEENNAGWLRNLATQLGAGLNLNRTIPDLEAEQFLLEVLRATADSNGDTQVVYPLLAKNTDKLNDNFAEILRRWATNRLAEVEPESAKYLAADIGNFSNLINQLPSGNKASNMEIGITGYEIALTIFTRSDFPQYWAMMQNNLGNAYRDRIRGDKAENLEQALAAFSAALQIYTRADFLQAWAMTQNNLGNAYRDRIRGDKAENLEQALTAYSAALQIYTRADFPQDWAGTQNNLGAAYRNRIRGDKAENLEQAIAAFSAALQIYTRADFPQDWAGTQNNLGNAYSDRIRGDKAENLEQAIAAFSAALQIYTRADFPQDWAGTQNNLGAAYRNRIRGDKAENLEQAIAAFSAALQIRTRTDFPQDWAMTQNNLGTAYSNRIRGDKAENLEQAIAAFSTVLQIYTRADFPQDWAMTQNNLGLAYSNRIKGDKAENLEQALAAYSAALQIYTRADFPQDWANTQNNLGAAYLERIRGNKPENLEQAITAYSEALQIYTRADFPQENARTLYNLGLAYQNAQQFNLAYITFADAIAGVEGLREEIISGDEAKRKQAEEWNRNYIRMVEVCLELGNITAAIEYVERSKTRNLVENILQRDAKTIFPLEVATQLKQLRDEIASGQYQIQNGKADNPKDLAQHLQQLRQQRNDLQDQYLPVGYSFKFDSFQSTLDANTVIIEWYLTFEKIIAFIINPQGQEITVWQSQPEDLNALRDLINKYLGDYYRQKDQWQNQLEERLNKLSEILHLEEILTHVPKHCDRLILIPHRFLHLLPLHTLPVKESYLLDLFPKGVGYAPSCQLLQQVQLRQQTNFQSLFAIQNPTEDLLFTDLEVDKILPLFSSHQLLPNKQATKAAIFQASPTLKNINSLHFSCHGSFNPNSPQDSYLLLHGADKPELDLSKCLTLGNLFERDFDLSQCRLVTLSACETGLIDFNNTSDEYIGLPSGFLYAGSTNVVNSLWTVNELSTALLMIHFYQHLHAAWTSGEDISVAVVLNETQRWLRNATKEDLQDFVSTLTLDGTWKGVIRRWFAQIKPGHKPFESPFHWAAFIAVGK